MNQILSTLRNNPSRVVACLAAALALATSFGVPITIDQNDRIIALATAILVLFAGQAERSLPPKKGDQ